MRVSPVMVKARVPIPPVWGIWKPCLLMIWSGIAVGGVVGVVMVATLLVWLTVVSWLAGLVALGLGEFVYCYYSGTTPSNTGTIVGAVAGFVTGVTVMGSK